jgi:hypothetical protein
MPSRTRKMWTTTLFVCLLIVLEINIAINPKTKINYDTNQAVQFLQKEFGVVFLRNRENKISSIAQVAIVPRSNYLERKQMFRSKTALTVSP